jgi:hypothetical protein
MSRIPLSFRHFAASLLCLSRRCRPSQGYKRGTISAVFLAVAMLMVIVVVSGQQISFIPNGAHFTNPGGVPDLQHSWQRL